MDSITVGGRPDAAASRSTTILVPTLNEEASVADVLRSIPAAYAASVLVVDGGSTDGTTDIVRRLGFRVIAQERSGLGNAILTGVKHSSGDFIVTLDADGAHTGAHLTKMLQKLDDGYDVAVASRYSNAPESIGMFSPRRRSTEPGSLIRGFGNRLYTWLCRVLFHVPLWDVLNGCKAFRRCVFETIQIERSGHEYDLEIVIKAQNAGFRLGDVPIDQGARSAGVSKLSVIHHGAMMLLVIVTELVRGRGRSRTSLDAGARDHAESPDRALRPMSPIVVPDGDHHYDSH